MNLQVLGTGGQGFLKRAAGYETALRTLVLKTAHNVRNNGMRRGGGKSGKSLQVQAESPLTYKVGTGFYRAVWKEKGTKPHTIKPKNKKVLFWKGIGTQRVQHPGTRAKPFLVPALEEEKPKFLSALRKL